MAWYADLGPIDYFPFPDGSALRAVGWLEAGHDYARGPVEEEDFARLCQLLVDPFQPVMAAGFHSCDLCRFTDGPGVLRFRDQEVRLGVANVFVPAGDVIYVAPSLILHYIDAHEYQPPEAFLAAARQCPEMRSMAYKKLLLASGGRGLRGPG